MSLNRAGKPWVPVSEKPLPTACGPSPLSLVQASPARRGRVSASPRSTATGPSPGAGRWCLASVLTDIR